MSNKVVTRNKESLLTDLMRRESTLPAAKMRHVPMPEHAHKELVKLVQRLFLSGSQNTQAVVFSAVEPGSGCTFISTRTAEILADQLGEPVCLVDANFRSRGINDQFEVEKQACSDEEWMFMPVGTNYAHAETSTLWRVVYRPAAADCPRLASLDRFQTLIEDLRKDFTYIVIDAPPLNEYPDATLLARMADGLVMVLEANDTRRETAQKAK